MSKELEALQDLSKLVFVYGGVEQYKIIENALKALEIIKEKKVYLPFIEQFDLKYYNEHCAYMSLYENYLTKEEYDLLREVLL